MADYSLPFPINLIAHIFLHKRGNSDTLSHYKDVLYGFKYNMALYGHRTIAPRNIEAVEHKIWQGNQLWKFKHVVSAGRNNPANSKESTLFRRFRTICVVTLIQANARSKPSVLSSNLSSQRKPRE